MIKEMLFPFKLKIYPPFILDNAATRVVQKAFLTNLVSIIDPITIPRKSSNWTTLNRIIHIPSLISGGYKHEYVNMRQLLQDDMRKKQLGM